jgi:hypothetical protein
MGLTIEASAEASALGGCVEASVGGKLSLIPSDDTLEKIPFS